MARAGDNALRKLRYRHSAGDVVAPQLSSTPKPSRPARPEFRAPQPNSALASAVGAESLPQLPAALRRRPAASPHLAQSLVFEEPVQSGPPPGRPTPRADRAELVSFEAVEPEKEAESKSPSENCEPAPFAPDVPAKPPQTTARFSDQGALPDVQGNTLWVRPNPLRSEPAWQPAAPRNNQGLHNPLRHQ
jgi:hypothetical protein